MRVAALIVALFSISLAGCPSNTCECPAAATPAELQALAARVQQLEAQLVTVQGQAEATATQVEQDAPTIAAAEGLLAVVSMNDAGDVVVSGANLYVQDGSGATINPTPNGKGNLIVGYDEPRTNGTCVGGDNDGGQCAADLHCPGGTCDLEVISTKTGSHNLVLGTAHTYTANGSLIAGRVNMSSANSGFVAGVGNELTATADASSILGGLDNTASGLMSVVVGGTENEATGERSIVP